MRGSQLAKVSQLVCGRTGTQGRFCPSPQPSILPRGPRTLAWPEPQLVQPCPDKQNPGDRRQVAQRWPPSLTSSGPLGFPAPCTWAWTIKSLGGSPARSSIPADNSRSAPWDVSHPPAMWGGCRKAKGQIPPAWPPEFQVAFSKDLLVPRLGMAPGEEEWTGHLTSSGRPAAHTLSLLGLFSGPTSLSVPPPREKRTFVSTTWDVRRLQGQGHEDAVGSRWSRSASLTKCKLYFH